MLTCPFIATKNCAINGRGDSNRIPLARLTCFTEKRLKGMSTRLGGEPGGARRVSYAAEANENGLVLFSSSASRVNKNMKAA
jgi:hypothetical protein